MIKNQLMKGDDAPSPNFKWNIEGFSRLTEKTYSEIFYVGGMAWRLLIYPKGNNVDSLSLYLDAEDSEIKSQEGWSIDAQFSLIVVNQTDGKLTVKKDTRHQFNSLESDWGFTKFMLLTDLCDPDKGYLVKDTCIIEAIVTVITVSPPKESTKTPFKTRSLKGKKNAMDFFKEASSNEGSSAERVLHIDSTESEKVIQFVEPPKQIDVSSDEKSPAQVPDVIEKPVSTLFHHFGSLKVRNPPYSLPNGCRITEEAALDEGNMSAQLIQSALLSSELQLLMEMPLVDLANQSYYHLAKFLHYHCASIASTEGLQMKHQELANVVEEIKHRDVEIQKLQLSLGKSAQEASQLRGDLEKVKEEKVKVADEFSAAKEKIISIEGELQLLRSENLDLQIQLEDARKAKQNAATQAVEEFKASDEYDNELRAMALDGLEQATELACARLKNKLPGFEPSMLDNLAKDVQA